MTGSPPAVCHIDVTPSYAQGTSAADHPHDEPREPRCTGCRGRRLSSRRLPARVVRQTEIAPSPERERPAGRMCERGDPSDEDHVIARGDPLPGLALQERDAAVEERRSVRSLPPADLGESVRAIPKRTCRRSRAAIPQSMLTANPAQARNASRPSTSCPTQTSTSGGSSETDVNEFAVNPCGTPAASRVVTTVTPVTKQPSACRSAAVRAWSRPLNAWRSPPPPLRTLRWSGRCRPGYGRPTRRTSRRP